MALAASSVDAGGPYNVSAEGSVLLTATGATNTVGCAVNNFTYRWDFKNDGTYDTAFSASRTGTFSAVGIDGPATITSKVEADPGAGVCFDANVTDTATVNVANVAPDVTNITVPSQIDEGASASFGAVFSDIESADTHTFKWNFGDGGGDVTGSATKANTFPDNGNFVVRTTVTDDDGGSDTFSVNVAVANVAPTITGKTMPSSGNEGASIAYSVTATDPGADTLTATWDWGDGTPDSTGLSVNHVFANQGAFPVVVTVDDGDGGSKTSSQLITISNVAPVITAITGPAGGGQSQNLAYVASATDAGSTDTLTYAWNFGDGQTSTAGASVSHAWSAQGTYTLSVTVCDNTAACDTETRQIVINNSNPTADLTGPVTGDEGSSLAYECKGTDPGGDPLTWNWTWGDSNTTPNGGDKQSHAFADEGSYAIDCTVKDSNNTSGSDTLTVAIANVAPTVTGTPGTTVVEGSQYTFTPGVSDPGTTDTHIFSLEGPEGMTIDSSTHQIKWDADWDDLGKHPVKVTIVDNDGGRGELAFEVEVTLLDADVDTLSDNWETDFGLNPADPADALLDGDGDGRDNATEWADATDPTSYDGPSIPTVLSPLDLTEVAGGAVTLQVGNSLSPDGRVLTYDFEIYEGKDMSLLLDSYLDVAEGSDGSTEALVDVTLEENTWYTWWAAATDEFTTGESTPPTMFFYNSANDAPTAPNPSFPLADSTVADTTPPIVFTIATDPDEDPLTYTITLTDGPAGTPVGVGTLLVGDGLNVSFVPDTALTDGKEYCFTGFATDDLLLAGPVSEESCFVVDTSNEAPSAPVWVSPTDKAFVTELVPVFEVTSGVDPEGRSTWHRFELDTSATFDSPDLQTAEVETGDPSTTFTPEALVEDTQYFARVLADDGAATSDWVQIEFFVNAENGAPTVPVLQNPGDGAAYAAEDMLEVVNATDPEGQIVHYEFAVYDASHTQVAGAADVEEGRDGITSFGPGELAPGEYTWSARAIDEQGAMSDFATERAFSVLGDPDTGDTGGDDKKCGCSSTSTQSGLFTGLLALLGLAAVRRKTARA